MKKVSLTFIVLIGFCCITYSQSVTVGLPQVWMTKNLDASTFKNVDPIPQEKKDEEWKKVREEKKTAWFYYVNAPANASKYDKLYNWHAVNDARDLNQLEEDTARVEDCPKPSDDMFEQLCDLIARKDVKYKDLLMKMSCVDTTKDSKITIITKINKTWDTYRKDFYCTGEGFRVKDGNILKYSVYKDFPTFVDGMVKTFDLDINFKDPADGKTVLDYIKDEIAAFKKFPSMAHKVKELEDIYSHFKNNLKAKHANEIP